MVDGYSPQMGEPLAKSEWLVFVVLFLLVITLRIIYIFGFRIDSDEPQHLHVAWALAQGLTDYRDVFDNHAPIFHMLMAPIVTLIGERPDILILARFLMLPFYLVTLWAVYRLTREMFGRRAGIWAVLALALLPNFLFPAIEFRTDNLWVTLWMLSLVVLLTGFANWKCHLIGGALLGATLFVSFKTVNMIAALLGAWILLRFVIRPKGRYGTRDRQALWFQALTFTLGFVMIPSIILMTIIVQGAWHSFAYCTILHNMIPGDTMGHFATKRLIPLPFLVLAVFFAREEVIWPASSAVNLKRAYFFLLTGMYFFVLKTLWPVTQRQTMLSFYPLLVIMLTGLMLVVVPEWFQSRSFSPAVKHRTHTWAPIALILINAGFSIHYWPPWWDGPLTQQTSKAERAALTAGPDWMGTREMGQMLSDVLTLTDSRDYVLDTKGETIFRQRPYYYVLEKFTRKRLKENLLPDNIAERCLATKTCVVVNNRHRFPQKDRQFMDAAYIDVGHLSVAGQWLNQPNNRGPIHFNVLIPTRYVIISEQGTAEGRLDGKPYEGPIVLAAGQHEYLPANTDKRLALVWARAAQKGFSPFHILGGNQ